MKLTAIFMLAVCLNASANGFAQKVSLFEKDVSLEKVFKEIKKQTGYTFVYREMLLKKAKRVSVNIRNASLEQVLDVCFQDQPLSYSIINKMVVIKEKEVTSKKEQVSISPPPVHIQGKVINEKGEPLAGATITEKGTNNTSIVKEDGSFAINVAGAKSILLISYVGYEIKEIPASNQVRMNITLRLANASMGEIVVVGYGSQKKISTTAAVATIKGDNIAQKPVVNLTNSIAGRVAGVISKQSTGEPGYDGADIRIRGIGTTGNNSPLLVVDGIPRDFSRLDPNTVESFTILKDAAAVAPYGIAGANGVILVTTKKGKTGAPSLTYNGYIGFQSPTRVTPQVNSYEYVLMKNEAAKNDGITLPYSDEDIAAYRNGTDRDKYPNSSPLNDIIENNSLLTYHNLELAGGSERVKYYAALGYTYQKGMWSSTHLKKYNAFVNIDAQATNTTKVNLSLNGWIEDQNFPAYSAGDIMYQAFRTPPTAPVYYTNGLWGQYIGRSLIGQLHHSGYNFNENTQILTTLSIEQQIPFIKGLSIKGVASFDPYDVYSKEWTTPVPVYTLNTTTTPYTFLLGYQGASKPILELNTSRNKAFTYQGYLNYKNSFGKNDITILAVVESRNEKYSFLEAKRINYNVNIDELNVGSADPADISNNGGSTQSKQVGYVYRLSYAHDGKYLAEVTGRYDGHYYFSPDKRFGFFPAYSIGWLLSKEGFIENNFHWIDVLKLRASYGEVGNLAGGPFQYLSTYGLGGGANFGGSPTQGIYERSQSNPNITWERAKKADIGLEGTLWKGKLTFEADYFYEKRSDMLLQPASTVPLEYGIPLSQVNAGKMNNKGFELALGSTLRVDKDLSLRMLGTFTYAQNRLLEVFETSATYNNVNRRRTGKALGTMFGYQALGYFSHNDFNPDGSLKEGIPVQPWGKVYPGDLRYADLSGADGKPDGKIDNNDETVIGNPAGVPQIIFGFNPRITYKNFDLDLLLQGASQTSIYLAGAMVFPFNDGAASATKLEFEDHWTPSNTNARYTRISTNSLTNNSQGSSWWVRDGTYMRLKSMEVGYSIPANIEKKLGVQSIRLYASGQNLFTWTPGMKEMIDPEAADGNGQYYFQQKVIAVGLNVSF